MLRPDKYELPVSFRLLAALIAGIVCGDAFPEARETGFALIAACMLLQAAGLFRPQWSMLHGLSVYLCMGSVGFIIMSGRLHAARYSFTGEDAFYRLSIQKPPEEKPRTYLCTATLLDEGRGDSLLPCSGSKRFLLYIAKDSASATLRRGDELLIHARLAPPGSSHIPDAFDYAHYLARQGVSGTAYIPSGQWRRIGHTEERSFRQKALDMREEVIRLYRRLGFQGDELAVLSALTVGYEEELSEAIAETYTVSGASHILALSGMHTAFLYGLLALFLAPLWTRWRFLKPFLLLFIIALMWGFAFLTGLSPSVVRAVVMCSLLLLVNLRTEKAQTLDALTAAAFLMLLFQPAWLFDVGFQLSFLAVAGIVLLYPKLNALCPLKPGPARKVWSLIAISIAAQLSTAPLVMHYFARFPTHFLLTNLWAVPLSTIILYAAVFMLALTPFPALQSWCAWGVNELVRLQNSSLQWIERLPSASIDRIWIGTAGTILLYTVILQANRCWRLRTLNSLQAALICLLLFAAHRSASLILDTPQTGITFYNIRGCPAVHCLAGGSHSWLVCTDSVPDASGLHTVLDPHWNRQQLQPPTEITGEYKDTSILVYNQLVHYQGKNICLLNDDRWRGKTASRPLKLDYLYIAKGYRGGVAELTSLFQIGQVILDTSVSSYYKKRIREDCSLLHIPCRLLEEESMVSFPALP